MKKLFNKEKEAQSMIRALELEKDFLGESLLLEVVLKKGKIIGQGARRCEAVGCQSFVMVDNYAYVFQGIRRINGEEVEEVEGVNQQIIEGLISDKDFCRQAELLAQERFNSWACSSCPVEEKTDEILPLYLKSFLCNSCREHYKKVAERARREANRKLRSLGAPCHYLFAL